MFSDISGSVADPSDALVSNGERAEYSLPRARRQCFELHGDALNSDFQGEGHCGQLLQDIFGHSDCSVDCFATPTSACPVVRRNACGGTLSTPITSSQPPRGSERAAREARGPVFSKGQGLAQSFGDLRALTQVQRRAPQQPSGGVRLLSRPLHLKCAHQRMGQRLRQPALVSHRRKPSKSRADNMSQGRGSVTLQLRGLAQ